MASSSLVSLLCLSSQKMTFKPMAALSNPPRTAIPYELKKGQNRLFHKLPSGLKMEVIEQRKGEDERRRRRSEKENSPLVFVHGSYHAAWCWAEHWLPFFSSSGFDSYAISLLGQGESDEPLGTVAGTLQTHASDIADFIESNLSSSPPVLIGHSFGGLIVQYYLANIVNKQSLGKGKFIDMSGHFWISPNAYTITGFWFQERQMHFQNFQGLYLFARCHLRVIGKRLTTYWLMLISENFFVKLIYNIRGLSFLFSGLVLRYLFSKPVAAFKVTLSLAAKRFQTSIPLCRETFFSSAMDDQLVQRYIAMN